MSGAVRRAVRRVLGPTQVDESLVVFGLLRREAAGVVMEVGAHFGDNALIGFAKRGWNVHAFEPDDENRAQLEHRVGGLPNVTVVAKAVADRSGSQTLYRSDESTGISSLAPFTGGHAPAGQVEVITLREYVSEQQLERVDYLKVDAEGYERPILAAFPWETHRPRAVLVEFEDRKTLQLGYNWRDLAEDLVDLGYSVLVSEWHPVVKYGGQHKWSSLDRYPADLRDPDGWGNLIAVEHRDLDRLTRIFRVAVRRARLRRGIERAGGRLVSGRRAGSD